MLAFISESLRNPVYDPPHDIYIPFEKQDNKQKGKLLVVINIKNNYEASTRIRS